MSADPKPERVKYFLVLTTAPSLKTARFLANLLVQKKLAACVSVSVACESHYVWAGKKEQARERMLLIKARQKDYKLIENMIRENHPYSVPEIIALPIEKGSSAYLNWLSAATRRD